MRMQGILKTGINVKNISVIYRNGAVGLRDVSFELPVSSICALVGVNGAGKSSLFKAIMGFLPISSGNILIYGMSVSSAVRNNLVAYVPQSEGVDWAFPILVEDVVMMGRYGYMNWLRTPSKNDQQLVRNSLERVGLTEYSKRQIGELSGGQRKRVFLARALVQKSKVILLDEPFNGVDVKTESAIVQLLKELRDEGSLILVATHNLGSVPEFCDHTILIKQTVLAYGHTKKIFTRINLEKTFGGLLRHFVLGGTDLHSDEDKRQVMVITDDERPFVIYSDEDTE